MADPSSLESELKELIVESLGLEDVKPADIDSSKPLFAGGLELDSIDALELAMAISRKYGMKIDGSSEGYKENFASVRNLAEFVAANRKEK